MARATRKQGARGSLALAASLAFCVSLAVIAGGVAYVVSHSLSKTYQASGTIRVGVPTQSGLSDSAVDAANDLTSQYAQLVGAVPVARIAAKRLAVNPASLVGKLAGSSVSGQNILMVTASGETPSQASARAGAGVFAVRLYLSRETSRQNATYTADLMARIRATKVAGIHVPANSQAAAQTDSQQDNALYEALRDAAGNQPTFQIVSTVTGPAAQVEPKPKLYALVAFVVVLLLSLRVAFVTMRSIPKPE